MTVMIGIPIYFRDVIQSPPTVWMVDDFMVILLFLSLLEKCIFSTNMFHVFTLFYSLNTKSEAKSNKKNTYGCFPKRYKKKTTDVTSPLASWKKWSLHPWVHLTT